MIDSRNDKILDNLIEDKHVSSRFSLEFDIKIFRYALLTYILYGVFSLIQLGAFVVPLPMVFIIVPLVAVIYTIRNQFVYQSILLITMPIVVLEELWMGQSPLIIRIVLLAAIVLWAIWGSSFLWKKQLTKTPFSVLMGVSQLFIFLSLVNNIGYFNYLGQLIPFVGAVIYYAANKNNTHIIKDLRIILLIQLIASLYLITLLSIGSV